MPQLRDLIPEDIKKELAKLRAKLEKKEKDDGKKERKQKQDEIATQRADL